MTAADLAPAPNCGATAVFHQLPPTYKLAGPKVDITAPDPRFIIGVARHAHYPIGELYPGLVMIVGNGGSFTNPHEMFMVGFDSDNRFMFATSNLTYCDTIEGLAYYLRTHPC